MAPSATITIEHNESNIFEKESLIQDNHGQPVAEDSKELVINALKERIKSIDTDLCEAGEEDAFFVADMGEIYRQQLRWKKNLQRVKPHYGKLARNRMEVVVLSVNSR
jgi:ornithine decarboxylase